MAHSDSNLINVSGELYRPSKNNHRVVSAEGVWDYNKNKSQEQINSEEPLHFGDEEPEFKETLWVSNDDMSEYNSDNTVVQNLYRRMSEIENILIGYKNIVEHGVIAGDSSVGARTNIMSTATPINPNSEGGEESEAIQPSNLGNTVPNISVKKDTAANFTENYQNLIDGEPVWITDQNRLFIYIDGKFLSIGGSGTGSGSGLSADEIMAMFFDYIGLKAQNGNNYRVAIDNNEILNIYCADSVALEMDTIATSQVWISGRLFINSIFIGGEGDERSYQCCSHNYVELANCSGHDINLNGLYLLYTPDKDTVWTSLPLKGNIKSGSTFLIRGAQCSAKTNTTVINVDEYDMEWRVNGELIKFSQTSPTFYLAWGDNNQFYNANNNLVPANQLTRVIWGSEASKLLKGYIDSVGINTGAAAEGNSPVSINVNDNWSDIIFVRTFTLDPCSQANKAYTDRKSNNLWTYINMYKEANETLNNPLYYYSKDTKLKFTPRCKNANKNIFTTKTTFDSKKPNMVNITFGKQATYKDSAHKASRCFNWISVGYYDEYLEYTLTTDTNWNNSTIIYSITNDSITEGHEYYNNDVVTTFIEQYKRIRWVSTNGTAVTTHKVLIFNLNTGSYKYRVKRKDNDNYSSEELTFTVKADSDVTSFEFVQTSDQQGFNWLEYQVWKKSALLISREHPGINFTINTGDITQNGNRENEWLDYYDGRQFLRDKEEMFTIGNNDLCGVEEYLLGDGTANTYKISHKNILYYYTFELDPNNTTIFTSESTTYYMPSLYSFNYGAYHFVSINSEFAKNTYKCYQSVESTFITDTYTQMADWFRKDLQLWKGLNESTEPSECGKCIVFCHEMPYTIITRDTRTGEAGRGGSKLNTMKTKGRTYYWSRIFKKYGIRLVIGGHKHTYSMTWPCYDAPEGYIKSDNTVDTSIDLFDTVTNPASMRPVVQVTDRSQIKENSASARYELVSSINAPLYVMCQATGYKLVSNRELPCDNTQSSLSVDWLKKCFPGTHIQNKDKDGNLLPTYTDKANPLQYRPTYILYKLYSSKIEVESYQVKYAYSEPTASKAGSFNINSQQTSSLEKLAIEGGDYIINL